MRPMPRGELPFSTGHRPWPPPPRPWAHAQTWHRLLFAHWPLPPAALRAVVPAALPLDTFDGQAWLGIVPFSLTGLRLRGLPPLPALSAFPELNVRTYVTLGGKPGVYFFSLDAANPLAVAGARLLRLPYCFAAMAVRPSRPPGGAGEAWVHYASRRLIPGPPGSPGAVLRARYRPVGPPAPAPRGTLDHWLTERYCLYTVGRHGRVHRLEIHHPPWPLRPAEADLAVNTLTAPLGLALPDRPPLLHYAHRQDVIGWLPTAVPPRGLLAPPAA
jgi:uncharacterized protein YqjF (DUF2071 family)